MFRRDFLKLVGLSGAAGAVGGVGIVGLDQAAEKAVKTPVSKHVEVNPPRSSPVIVFKFPCGSEVHTCVIDGSFDYTLENFQYNPVYDVHFNTYKQPGPTHIDFRTEMKFENIMRNGPELRGLLHKEAKFDLDVYMDEGVYRLSNCHWYFMEYDLELNILNLGGTADADITVTV